MDGVYWTAPLWLNTALGARPHRIGNDPDQAGLSARTQTNNDAPGPAMEAAIVASPVFRGVPDRTRPPQLAGRT